MKTFTKQFSLPIKPLVVYIVISTFGSSAFADNGQPESDWRVTTGFGVYAFPEFDGSDEHQILPIPMIDVTYKNRFFFNLFDGIGMDVIKTEDFTLKASVAYEFGREEKDSELLTGTGDIDAGAKIQLSAEYEIGRLTPFVKVENHLSGAEGMQAELGVETMFRFGESYTSPMLILELSAEYSNEDHMLGYYGISTEQSINTGLAVYTPEAGISAYSAGVTYIHPFAERWATTATAKFTTITGDAADSPLILEENQISGGFFVTYTF
jgi:outer membrane scaffolding protein for murein synthesis (MipA/OmpV family)